MSSTEEIVDFSAAWQILEDVLRNNEVFLLVIPLCHKILTELTSFCQITSSACRGLSERYIPAKLLEGIWIENIPATEVSELSSDDKKLWHIQDNFLSELKCIVTICFLALASLDAKILEEQLSDSLQEAYSHEVLVRGGYLLDTNTSPFEGLCENETRFLTNFRKFVVLSLMFISPSRNKAFIMKIAAHFEGREQCARYCAGGGQTIHTIRREIIFESEAKRMYPYYGKNQKEARRSPESKSHAQTLLELVLTKEKKSEIEDVVADFITSGINTSWPRLDLIVDCENDKVVFATIEHMRYLYGDIWHVPGLQGVLISEVKKVVASFDRNERSYHDHMSRVKKIPLTSLLHLKKACKTLRMKTYDAMKAAMLSCRLYCFYLLHKQFIALENATTYLERFKVWIILAIKLNGVTRAMQVSVTACGRLEESNRSYSFGGDSDVYTKIRKKIYYHLTGQGNIGEDSINHKNGNDRGEMILSGMKRARSEVTEDDLESASTAKRSNSPAISIEQSDEINDLLQDMQNDPLFSAQPLELMPYVLILSRAIIFINCVMFLQMAYLTDNVHRINDEGQPDHWMHETGDSLVTTSPSNLMDSDEDDKSVHVFWDDNKENNNENRLDFGRFYAEHDLLKGSVISSMEMYPFHTDDYEVIEYSRQQYSLGSSNDYSQTTSFSAECSCSLPVHDHSNQDADHWMQETGESLVAMSPSNLTDSEEEDKSVHAFWDDNKENNNGNHLDFGRFYAEHDLLKGSVISSMKGHPPHKDSRQQYSLEFGNDNNAECSCSLPMSL